MDGQVLRIARGCDGGGSGRVFGTDVSGNLGVVRARIVVDRVEPQESVKPELRLAEAEFVPPYAIAVQ